MNDNKLFPLSKSWSDFPLLLKQNIDKLNHGAVIVEIGGGANPCLTRDQVQNFHYIVIDINQEELNKAKGNYFEKVCTDITKNNRKIKCDIIITNMLLEHIPNPQEFHQSCFEMLNEQGKAIHFFATKISPASIINIILPEKWSRRLLYKIQNRKWETQGKFPAYYRWCFGPINLQISRFEKLGFGIELFRGYLGSGYLKNIFLLRLLENYYNYIIMFIRSSYFCSNSIVVLYK